MHGVLNVAQAQKYGDYSVNLATGVPSIAIPIYTPSSGDLQMPVVLNYHASGHKLSDKASWVGWGWSLTVGGSVSRNVQGQPDDKDGFSGSNYLNNPIVANRNLCSNASDYGYANNIRNNIGDGEPDIFSMNAGNLSGRFLLGQGSDPQFLIPWQPFKVEKILNPTTSTLAGFDIVDDQGKMFTFGQTPLAQELQYNINARFTSTYINAWHLTELKSPNTDDKISLSYQDGGFSSQADQQWSVSIISHSSPTSGGQFTDTQSATAQQTNISAETTIKHPHILSFENGELEFVQSTSSDPRLDLPTSNKLNEIRVYSFIENVKTLLKTIKFHYSYFKNSDNQDGRLKLDSLEFTDAISLVKEIYRFQYFTNSYSWNDLATNYNNQDYFGYYNGASNQSLIGLSNFNTGSSSGLALIPIVNGGANRAVSANYIKEGVLEKIIYPTGGSTVFDLEQNQYSSPTGAKLAGGLRIKSIKNFDKNQVLSHQKRYEYATNGTPNVGYFPTYWEPESIDSASVQNLYYSNAFTGETATAIQFILTPFGQMERSTFDAAPQYYTHVSEYFEEPLATIKNGRNEYLFDFFQDQLVTNPFYQLRNIKPWKRGNLLERKVFDSNSNLLKSENNTYSELKALGKVAAAFVGSNNVFSGSIASICPTGFIQAFGQSEMTYSTYQYYTGNTRLTSVNTVSDGVQTSSTTLYDDNLLPLRITSNDSKPNHFKINENVYASDAIYDTDPIVLQIRSRNMVGLSLEYIEKENLNGLINPLFKQKTVYNSFTGNNARGLTNNLLPAEMWVAPIGGLIEKRVDYKNYDAFGNILSYEVDGQPTTLIYGYNNSLVTGIVKNANLSQVNTALSSSGLSQAAFSVSTLSAGQETILQNFQNALPNTLIDWYVYRPNIGLSQHFTPNGLKTNYFYDTHQRFSKATDHEGNILQSNFYKISPTENYIVSTKPRIATTNDISANLYFNSIVDYQYFDGLGRPTQAIGIGQSPDQKSIIKTEISYDKFNRQLSSMLPIAAGSTVYVPIPNAKSLAQGFYANVAPTDSSIFEASPLNRIKATFGVGNAWRIADKKTQLFYEAGGNEVRNYSVNSSGNIVLSGTYPANSLFKKRMLDEQGHEIIEYTDKRGRMIEKRQQLETGVYAHTHYIYDGLGRPKAIIQPMGYELNTGFSYNSTNFQNWVFFYNYDFRGRNDLKHVPATGFTKMVYDKKDRLVMQQDALQATLNKWNFQKYDAFSREVFRGETLNSNSQSVLQTAFNSHTAPDEVWSSGGGYNGGSFPSLANPSGNDVQHYTFYDQYDFVAALNTNFNFDAGNSYHTKHSSAKSLQTESVSYNLADHNQYFMSATYFDTKNRPIQSFETHVLSPTLPNRADVEYNFSGEVLKNRTLHKQVGKPDITELYENEYDHVGRPTKIFHTLNGIKTEISRFTYDPIGRQISKKIKAGFTYKAGISDIIIRNSEPPTNTQDYVRRNIQLNPGFVYCPDSLSPSLYFGQVDTLGLGSTTDALQTIDYSYNIRNGLRGINLTNDQLNTLNKNQNDLFGMKLDFHETGLWYDGNIHKQTWLKANDNIQRSYTYNYDFSKRLKSAAFQTTNNEDFSLPTMAYDKNGNILSLARKGKNGSNFNLLDDLSYSYSGNKLLQVEDAVSDTSKNYFNNRNIGSNDFEYDPNGNLKKDLNENINQINYNTYLNQPIEVIKSDGSWEKSFYDGSGHLFKRTNSLGTTWTYSGNIIYKNDTLYQIGTREGRIIQDTLGNFHYQFEYRDLTSNLRLLYQDPTIGNPATRMAPEIVQSQDYEPFGVGFNEYFGSRNNNKFGYSNHEIGNDLGLNRIDFGNRTYNPTYGRFDKSDIMMEKFNSLTNYNFTLNNPINIIDPDGNEARDIWGNTTFQGFVGDDGSGNFVGSTSDDGADKGKGKKKEEEQKTSREKALEVKGKGFWEFMNFAFSTDGLSFLIDEIYKVEGSGNLAENAHPVEKVNELAAIYATGKLFVTIGKGSNAFKKTIEIPKGFRETGQFRKVGAAKAPILTNGKVFISPDLTEHNTEGWKMAKTIKELGNKTTRTGTFDSNLNLIKK